MSDELDVTTADMLEIVAGGGNGVEYVDIPGIMERAAEELRGKDTEIERLRAREKSLTLEGLALIGRVEQTREALAGTDDASLPRDYPLERMAHDRMAEIERLRAALKLVAELDTNTAAWPPGLTWAISSARAALEGK